MLEKRRQLRSRKLPSRVVQTKKEPYPKELIAGAAFLQQKESAPFPRLPVATVPDNLGVKLLLPKHRHEIRAIEGYHVRNTAPSPSSSVTSLNSSFSSGERMSSTRLQRFGSVRRSYGDSPYGAAKLRSVNSYRSNFLTGNTASSQLSSKASIARKQVELSPAPNIRRQPKTYGLVAYSGDYFKSVRRGEGEAQYSNEDCYRGNWSEDVRDGYGEYCYKEIGAWYKGDWRSDLKHGSGILVFSNGDKLECVWSQDQIHDKTATITYSQLEATYIGEICKAGKHGSGELTFPNKVKYRGQWHSDKRHGTGIQYTTEGLYEGEFRNDCVCGRGILLARNKLLCKPEFVDCGVEESAAKSVGDVSEFYHFAYSVAVGATDVVWKAATSQEVTSRIGHFEGAEDGQFSNGVLSGCGVALYGRFATYIGTFKEGKRSGYGQLVYRNPDGVCTNFPSVSATYIGRWRNDERHGTGRMEWEDGTVYEGQFLRDRRHKVEGVMTTVGGERYEGTWKFELMHGKGRLERGKGLVFVGEFTAGRPSREGELMLAEGGKYKGEVVDMQPHGHGKMTYLNGDVYTGDFQSGLRHGQGTMDYANGDKYQGDWRHGVRHGSGELVTSTQVFSGLWRSDRPHGPGALHLPTESVTGNWSEGEAQGFMQVAAAQFRL